MDFLQKFDSSLIAFLQKWQEPLARFAIFLVYFWFGLLKLFGMSPAGPLVHALFDQTISFVSFDAFYTFFSVFEMVIGVAFLIRGFERFAIFLLFLHLITTVLPLFFLPAITWQGFLIPTLEGQYIIKNILIVALALVIGARLAPLQFRKS